jgi:hypothetical protein
LRILKTQIDSILTSVIGVANFERYVKFDSTRSYCDLSIPSKYVVSSKFEYETIDFDPNHIDLTYSLSLTGGKSFDEEILVRIFKDTSRVVIYISGIPQCLRNEGVCRIMTSDSAKKIAQSIGFAKGLKEWKVSFRWKKNGIEYLRDDKKKIMLDIGDYYWNVATILQIWESETSKDTGTKFNAKGKEIEVNSDTGIIIQDDNIMFFISDYE